jgi:hypothetical protein
MLPSRRGIQIKLATFQWHSLPEFCCLYASSYTRSLQPAGGTAQEVQVIRKLLGEQLVAQQQGQAQVGGGQLQAAQMVPQGLVLAH